MKCRHCLVEYHPGWIHLWQGNDSDGPFGLFQSTCAACGKLSLGYSRAPNALGGVRAFLYPAALAREPVDKAVPNDFASLYVEACNTLEGSPRASAALSRHCLQHILRECAKVKHGNLDSEIQQVLDSKDLPSHIGDSLDAVRTLGNFAAHPIKSTSSGEVVNVEPGEAEWNVDTLLSLFDFYFVQPARTAARRAALNQKLSDARKPPLK
jgi:Domain of unknown function (DUF4145)